MSFKSLFLKRHQFLKKNIEEKQKKRDPLLNKYPIFSKRMNKEGAIAGMITGLTFTASYIIYFKFINPSINSAENWWFGISPEGIGTLGMVFNFLISFLISRVTAPPPQEIKDMVDDIRIPQGTKTSYHHHH